MDVELQKEKISQAKAVLEEKHKACVETYSRLKEHLTHVLEKNIDLEHVKVQRISNESAELNIIGSNHSIDLYFYSSWNGGKTRRLEINFGCFGSFDKDDHYAVKYCETLGHVASILPQLEEEMLKTDEAKKLFAEHNVVSSEEWEARSKFEDLKRQLKAYEQNLKRDEILSQLKPGVKVIVKKPSQWIREVVKTVDHITGKNILFIEDYGRRTSKDEIVSNLITGKWELKSA